MLFILLIQLTRCIEYSITKNVLRISGNGAINQAGVRSKGDYTKITEVIIENGPTAIESDAFYECSSLLKATISETIESIATPFSFCPKLATIIVNSNNQNYCSVGDALYTKNQTELITAPSKNFQISENTLTIKQYAFSNKNQFVYEEIRIPDKTEVFENNCFREISAITFVFNTNPSLKILNGITWCTITTFVVPNSCTEFVTNSLIGSTIGEFVFQSESKLQILRSKSCQYLQINSTRFPDSLEIIEEDAFYKSTTIQSLSFGKGLSNLSSNAFTGCTNLKSVTISSENPSYISKEGMIMTKNEDSIIFITPGKKSITIHENVSNIGLTLLQSQTNLTEVIVDSNNLHFKSKNGVLYNYNMTKAIAVCGGCSDVTIDDSVEEIGESFAFNCINLTTFHFTSLDENCHCKNISNSAFQSSGLTSMELADSITIISKNAFQDCFSLVNFIIRETSKLTKFEYVLFYRTGITDIFIPQGITSIPIQCFDNSKLKTIKFSEHSMCSVFDTSCFRSTLIESIEIPSSTKIIGSSVFSGCLQLKTIIFKSDDSVTSIGDNCFENCKALESIQLPSSCASIGKKSFSNCQNLSQIINKAKTINSTAFENCASLESFEFSEHISTLDAEIFKGCVNLMSFKVSLGNTNFKSKNGIVTSSDGKTLVLFPPGQKQALISSEIENFGERAFAYSITLERLLFRSGNNMTSFSAFSFAECSSLEFLQFPPLLHTISESCFTKCTALRVVEFQSSLCSIGINAFVGCSSLTTIKYCGTNEINTIGVFDTEQQKKLVAYVEPHYEYSRFCDLDILKVLSYDCDLTSSKVTCGKQKNQWRFPFSPKPGSFLLSSLFS